jgi:hypothetical protein
MNIPVRPRRALLWAVFLAWLSLVGCATPHVDWTARIGVYTYDQAVLDYGPPDKQVRLQDGTTVAEWLIRRGYPQTYVPYGYGSPYWNCYPYYYPAYVTSYVPDYYLRLIFGANNRLVAWKNIVK